MTDFDGLAKALDNPGAALQEWDRLARDRYSMAEFAVQAHHIKRLVPAGAAVIDIGCGPGRYAIELLKRGRRVALADLSGACLKKAEEEIRRLGLEAGLLAVSRQNAVKLDAFGDGQFDHALLMGPLLNMDEHSERLSALQEAARVVKPGGFIFATVLSHLRPVAEMFYVPSLKFRRTALDNYAGRITEALGRSLDHPVQVMRLIAESGLEIETVYGADSAAGLAFDRIDEMAVSEETWQKMLDVLVKISEDPTIAGLASHTTYVLRRRA